MLTLVFPPALSAVEVLVLSVATLAALVGTVVEFISNRSVNPLTVEAVPTLYIGAESTAGVFTVAVVGVTVPAIRSTLEAVVLDLFAEHDTAPAVDAVELTQFHVHGPDPETCVAIPTEQRLAVGRDATVVPFAEPQAGFVVTEETDTRALALTVAEELAAPHMRPYVVVCVGYTTTEPLVAPDPLVYW